MTIFEISGAGKAFRRLRGPNVTALAGVDFDISAGEIVGLVGPNGAGKSTLLLAAAGLLALDRGSVQRRGPLTGPAGLIGFAPERAAYQQTETVAEVLRTFAIVRGIPGNRIHDELERAMAETSLQEHACKRVSALSRGMLQRLSLAQALLGNPRLLLLDETLSGVDPVVHHEICHLLSGLPARGTAVVLSSHDLSAVEELAARVVVMSAGRVRGVLAAGDYARAGSLRARFLELLDVRGDRHACARVG